MDEASKSSVGSLIQQLPEDDLRKASAETLSFYLHEVGDLNVRRIVAVRLHHRIQDLQPPSDPGYQDELCLWLDEAVSKTPKPSNWKADTVQSFEHDMLGKAEMGNKLGIRNCFTSMYEDLVKPWLNSFEPATPFGVFVITGTPGIGKSVFLAYVASRLAEEGINIVIQLGKRWWSRISGQTITHNDTWPVKLLDDSKTVLLADPVGGENSQPVDPRMCGCTIIFTSPQQKNYDSVWKQAEGRSERYFMPVWSEEEVLNHWKAGGR
ncbi:unnamed protein product [Effrenium voratum]|nr:unnamed protein product [Effrenium voratum]